MTRALTDRQRNFLATFARLEQEAGSPPTYRELGAALGIGSPNGVAVYVKALMRKGMLAQERANIARPFRLTIAGKQVLGLVDAAAIWETKRLLVYRMAYQLPQFRPRDLLVGFLKDIHSNPVPLVTMTVDAGKTPAMVDWIQTHDLHRGQGFGTELWRGVERLNGAPLQGVPVTESGERFMRRLESRKGT